MGASGVWKAAVALCIVALSSACATGGSATYVEGALRPRHFVFHEVVKQRGKKPGGWMAACLHVGIARDTGELVYCRFGVEMPSPTVRRDRSLWSKPKASPRVARTRQQGSHFLV